MIPAVDLELGYQSPALKQFQEQQQQPSLLRRAVKRLHWSHLPICSCCVVSAVVAVAALAFAGIEIYLQRYVETAIGAVLFVCFFGNCITHAVSAIGVAYFKPFKSFEKRVKEFKELVEKMDQERKDLAGEIEKLRELEQKLNETLQNSRQSVQTLENTLSSKTTELMTVVNQLSTVKERNSALQALYEKFKKENIDLLKKLGRIKELNQKIRENASYFDAQDKEMDEQREKMQREVSRLDGENAELDQLLQGLSPMLDNFTKNVLTLDDQFDEMNQQMEDIDKIARTLDQGGNQFQQGADTLASQVIPELSKIEKRLSATLERANELLSDKVTDDTETSQVSHVTKESTGEPVS